MIHDTKSTGMFLLLVFSVTMSVINFLCYIKYDKNPTFQKLGKFFLTLRFCGKDKSQLLIFSIGFLFFAVLAICTLLGIAV